ncbi:MAG: putative aminopeptidase [Chitinophagaceae bacterium]|nr:putative aminopeptidase [Chitinophagaceae bacterium]
MIRQLSILSLLSILVFACNEKQAIETEDGLAAFSADSLANNIKQLSSDDFMGRKPFTEGETKTIDFLQTKFKSLGLEPGNGNSYLQDVPMVNIATVAAPSMTVQSSKGNFELKGFDDYVIWTDRAENSQSFNNDEVVFAGYGVVAPEYNWNDYAGLDVKGKIVLILVNDPGFYSGDTALFKGKTMTYYGRWTYKFEEAARQGAKGCLIIHTREGSSYPFSVVQNNWNGSKLHLDNRGKDEKACSIIGWVSSDAAKRMLTAAGTDTTLLAKADQKGFKAVPLNLKLSTSMKVTATYNKSHNVIAKITGSKYPDEYIIYTAHWDHLGIGKPDSTHDSIYNGALDNASGTSGLLELGRVYKSLKTKPERTIVFLSVTAEEQGLWGSAYYAQNPVYPVSKTVANINMDGLNAMGKTKDISVVGKGQSDLEDILKTEADKQNRVLAFETHPEAGHYYRSDHFNFAKVGVPALDASSGIDLAGKGKVEGQRLSDEYTTKYYHRPSDQFNPNWNLEGAIEDLQLFFLVGKTLAYNHTWPGWKQGSEFKAIRDKTESDRK